MSKETIMMLSLLYPIVLLITILAYNDLKEYLKLSKKEKDKGD